jgi:hypothetical protein
LRHVSTDDEPLTTEYLPSTQLRHVVTEDEPFTPEYVPTTQLMQSDRSSLPIVSRYFPGGQQEQVFPVKAPTAAEYVPVPQSVHTAAPVDVLYFPATHAVHVPPSGPVEPELQVQFVKAGLPEGELEADGQARHVELDAAFTAVE